MTTYRALLPFALAILISTSPRANAAAGFNDGDFTTYTWTAQVIQDNTSGQNTSISAGEVPSGGFGGVAFRSNSFSFDYTGSAFVTQGILIANTNTGMIYSPAISGPINSISSFGITANLLSYSDTPSVVGLLLPHNASGAPQIRGPSLSVGVGLLLVQNGNYYTNQFQGLLSSWNSIKVSSPQSATDFTLVGSSGGPVNPDFTANGNPILFGYILSPSFSSVSPESVTGVVGVDQYAVSISNTPTLPQFTSEQPVNAASVSVTLSGLAAGESITWLVSTDLVNWSTNNPHPTSTAAGTNGTFTITNLVSPTAPNWFLNALVQ